MVSLSYSTSYDTLADISIFQSKEGHSTVSGAISHLIRLGLVYKRILDAQEAEEE